MPGYLRIIHAGGAVETTLQSNINDSVTSIPLTVATGWPSPAASQYFYMVIDPDTASEEKVLCSARSGTTVTAKTSGGRGADGSVAIAHVAGAVIRHIWSADEADEANVAVNELLGLATAVGQVPVVDGAGSYAAVQGKTSGQVLMGNGTTVASTALSGDVTVNGSGVTAIGTGKVTSAMMLDGTIVNADINAAAAIAYSKLALGTSIVAGDLATGAVTSAKILDGTITTGDIADDAITAAKIAADAVGSSEIATSAVTTAEILDGTIVAGDLDVTVLPRWVLGPFVVADTTAGASATFASYGSTTAGIPVTAVTHEAGSVIGISVACNSARTAGTLTAEVYIGGVATGLSVTLDGTHTTTHYTVQARGLDTFAAGNTISVKWSSDGSWAAFATDGISATVLCST